MELQLVDTRDSSSCERSQQRCRIWDCMKIGTRRNYSSVDSAWWGTWFESHWRSPWRQFEDVVFHKLDIADPDSVTEFAIWLKQTYDGLDILIIPKKNLSISLWNCCWCGNIREVLETSSEPPLYCLCLALHCMNSSTDPRRHGQVNNPAVTGSSHTYDTAVYCLSINYFGTINSTENLFPMFNKSAAGVRIINISSTAGFLAVSHRLQDHWILLRIFCGASCDYRNLQ